MSVTDSRRRSRSERGRPGLPTPRTRPRPNPTNPRFWRSPIRGPWLTSFLGTLLVPGDRRDRVDRVHRSLGALPGACGNSAVGPGGDIPVLFHFPASWPSWSYAVTQGTHVTLGLMVLPLVLAKLWSVMPKLFQRPVVKSLAGALERISLLGLVAQRSRGVRHRHLRHGRLGPMELQLQHRSLLRRVGVWDVVRAACLHQAPSRCVERIGSAASCGH